MTGKQNLGDDGETKSGGGDGETQPGDDREAQTGVVWNTTSEK